MKSPLQGLNSNDSVQPNTLFFFLGSAGTGLLLGLCWPDFNLPFLGFIAFLPLLWMGALVQRRFYFLLWALLSMLIWNLITSWWIWNASPLGVFSALMVNGSLQLIPWYFYHRAIHSKKNSFKKQALMIWVLSWMCIEFFHLQDWGLSWPWLTLGNSFAAYPTLIQWYEFTGAAGGSLWILLMNVGLYSMIQDFLGNPKIQSNLSIPKKSIPTRLLSLLALLSFPLLLSWWRSSVDLPQNEAEGIEVVVVQPNIDPYTEKFESGSMQAQVDLLINLSKSKITPKTQLVVWPETAVPFPVFEDQITYDAAYASIRQFLTEHPQLSLFTGINSYGRLPSSAADQRSARKSSDGSYYEAYNAAMLWSAKMANPLFYHKTKLVPGVEMMPNWLWFLDDLMQNLGGISGTYGTQENRTALPINATVQFSPSICYESVYGAFMSKYAGNGANLMAIITNDGWWGNTPGHRQHFHYASLRAIENRQWIVRSANTGISAFVSPDGTPVKSIAYNEKGAMNGVIFPNRQTTFYQQYPDLIYLTSTLLFGFLLLNSWRKKNS